LQRVEDLLDAGQTVWVTGHSLGGALATLAAARLYDAGIEPYVTCTFGAPRVLDPKAAAAYLPRLYRFVNKGDLVPTVPTTFTLPWYWYQHTGSLAVVLDAERGASASVSGKDRDLFSVAKSFFSPAVDWQKNITQRLTDHAMKTYMALIRAELGADAVARMEREQTVAIAKIKPRRAA
jgi:pimeloyl-ACP methyl ester carboxylesterase